MGTSESTTALSLLLYTLNFTGYPCLILRAFTQSAYAVSPVNLGENAMNLIIPLPPAIYT